MAHKFLAILTFPFVFAGSPGACATDRGAPAPVARIGSTEKICQLTGERDWETGEPTSARSFTNFGLDAPDLGYPIEHSGKLILLFNDSWPPRHPGGAAGEIPPDDASASLPGASRPATTASVSRCAYTTDWVHARSSRQLR